MSWEVKWGGGMKRRRRRRRIEGWKRGGEERKRMDWGTEEDWGRGGREWMDGWMDGEAGKEMEWMEMVGDGRG